MCCAGHAHTCCGLVWAVQLACAPSCHLGRARAKAGVQPLPLPSHAAAAPALPSHAAGQQPSRAPRLTARLPPRARPPASPQVLPVHLCRHRCHHHLWRRRRALQVRGIHGELAQAGSLRVHAGLWATHAQAGPVRRAADACVPLLVPRAVGELFHRPASCVIPPTSTPSHIGPPFRAPPPPPPLPAAVRAGHCAVCLSLRGPLGVEPLWMAVPLAECHHRRQPVLRALRRLWRLRLCWRRRCAHGERAEPLLPL